MIWRNVNLKLILGNRVLAGASDIDSSILPVRIDSATLTSSHRYIDLLHNLFYGNETAAARKTAATNATACRSTWQVVQLCRRNTKVAYVSALHHRTNFI